MASGLTRARPRKRKRPRVGRPTKLSAEVQEKILADVRAGAFAYVAAQRAGIDKATFFRWMARGESGEQPFCDFRDSIRAAHYEARVVAEAEIYRTDKKFWLQHAARDKPGEPGWTDRHEITGAEGQSLSPPTTVDDIVERLRRDAARAQAAIPYSAE